MGTKGVDDESPTGCLWGTSSEDHRAYHDSR